MSGLRVPGHKWLKCPDWDRKSTKMFFVLLEYVFHNHTENEVIETRRRQNLLTVYLTRRKHRVSSYYFRGSFEHEHPMRDSSYGLTSRTTLVDAISSVNFTNSSSNYWFWEHLLLHILRRCPMSVRSRFEDSSYSSRSCKSLHQRKGSSETGEMKDSGWYVIIYKRGGRFAWTFCMSLSVLDCLPLILHSPIQQTP